MEQLRTKAINKHISDNYSNAKVVSYLDQDKNNFVYYSYDELKNVSEDWYPLCCYRDSKTNKLMYGGKSRIYHTYTEGETGAGKTTRLVMQNIKALSSLKNKPSFVIVDIHGEIIENMYLHFIEQGYDVKILNCDDASRSDTYNPFNTIAESCIEKGEINDSISNRIRKIAEIMQPVESTKDPIWDIGARSYTNGLILDKFEDLIEGTIDKKNITIYNIIQSHYWVRQKLASVCDRDLLLIDHYRTKGTRALSVQKMISVTNNAERTRDSYFGVVENHFDCFGQTSLYELSSSNTIDIKEFIERPTVIVIQSATTKTGDALVSLLMNDLYTTVVETGKKNIKKKLNREIHCYLDEFANCNIATGEEFISMLTTSRKFGLHWHLILQCDAQLDSKYDNKDIGKIIRANCSEIFMGSHDYQTMERFAFSCGEKTVESLESKVVRQTPSLETVKLITPDKLYKIPEGYMYIRTSKSDLLYSYYEAFYKCKEFEAVKDIDSVYPHNNFKYTSTVSFPGEVNKKVKPLNSVNPQIKLDYILEHLKWIPGKNGEMVLSVDLPEKELKNRIFPKKDVVEEDEMDALHSMDNLFISVDLQTHIEKNNINCDNYCWFDTSCIPESVRNYYECPQKKNPLLNSKTLLYEILEEYLGKNNFKTKKEWEERIKYECALIKDYEVMPLSVYKYFAEAEDEIVNNLTLKDITEMKKIIK